MNDSKFTIISLHEMTDAFGDTIVIKNSLSDLYNEIKQNKMVMINMACGYVDNQIVIRKTLLDSGLISNAYELTNEEATNWIQTIRETVGNTENKQ